MPETEQAQHLGTGDGRSRLADFVILLLVMAVEAVIIILIMMRPSGGPSASLGGETSAVNVSASRPMGELMAPSVDVENIITTVRVDDAGSRIRTLMMSISLKIGRVVQGGAEESLDLKYLEEEYRPRVERLVPKIKDMLIQEASSRTYSELLDLSVKQQILENVKRRVNQTLTEHGVKPRIIEVYWLAFHFS